VIVMEIPVRMRQTQTRQPKQRNPYQGSSVRQRPLEAKDPENLPVAKIDPSHLPRYESNR
jgi:hypothetical protein